MKKTILALCSLAVLACSCNSGESNEKAKNDSTAASVSEVKKDASPVAPTDSATMMKNWQAYMNPGDMHKMIASWSGAWTAEITMWEKPGSAPNKSTGSVMNKMVLGGRYQESVHTGTMMGMPFEGHGTLGYDNAKNIFESTWIDNMGSGIIKMSGPWVAATRSVTLTGMMTDPGTFKETEYKETFTVIDDNTQMMAMYAPGADGKEFKMMEIKYSRKK